VPDFVVDTNGTTIPVSQNRMGLGFEQAGFASQAAVKTPAPGVIYTVPTRYGPIDVRMMEGSVSYPRRAVFTRAGTNDPVTMSGESIRGNVSKQQRRALSHLEQNP
jgi:hypothetical protein